MNKKLLRTLILFILGVVLSLTPFDIFQIYAHNQKHVYSKTYYAALVDKVNYLESLKDEKKIVLIGGSNVAFGFNSKLLEEECPNYKVVNFGLYAALGTKLMLDLSKDYIGKDDMVFIIPEINKQSMSLYFDASNTLKAFEDRNDLMYKLSTDDRYKLYGEYFNFVKEKDAIGDIIDPGETVYKRNNFNEYGDISYVDENSNSLRLQNEMSLHYDLSTIIKYNDEAYTSDFFDYINAYFKDISSKGASAYFSFCPVNDLCVSSRDDEIISFYWKIRDLFNYLVVGNPQEYILDSHYFYDTNFHLNDAGALYRTRLFINDIKRDILREKSIKAFDIPDIPDYKPEDEYKDNGYSSYFKYSKISGSYVISGVSDEHIDDSQLTTSTLFEGEAVKAISKNAFVGANNLETLIITSNIGMLENGSFNGAKKLKSIYLLQTIPSKIIVDYQKKLFEEPSDNIKIYVPKGTLSDYKTDYNWSNYIDYLMEY